MKFDSQKDRWDIVPVEYLNGVAASMVPFIQKHFVEVSPNYVCLKSYLYNLVRSSIFIWRKSGRLSLVDKIHPLMTAMIGLLFLIKPRDYKMGDVNFLAKETMYRWDLVDPEWMTMITRIYTYGAAKYEVDNWKKVDSDRYFSALNRHIDAFARGSNYDDESGFHHLYHAAWNCIALMWFEDHSIKGEPIPTPIMNAAAKLRGISGITIVPKKVAKKKGS